MSKFLISCGGTGGHLSPGIALAEGLAARGHEALLLVSRKKVDARLLEKYPHLRFACMPGSGFSLRPLEFVKFCVSQVQGFVFCFRLLRAHHADGVVGFGGFTSAPLVLAARVLGVPSALHESNRVPGRAIRMLGRFANRVYLPPGIRIGSVPASTTRHVGLPVRREIARSPQAEARLALGLEPHQKVLVILGGSQGSSALNDWAREHVETFASEGVQIYCVTGLGKGSERSLELKTKTGAPMRAHFVAFSDRIGELLSAADLVVSRAGAGTLVELTRCETPAILVPFPQAADDHQRANAAYFAQEGGGLAIEQAQLAQLRSKVLDLIGNDWLLKKFRANLQRLDRANSLELMLRDLEELVSHHRGPLPAAPVFIA
jgi:UDP-N-acetylglucosamine--N-acetylmuramyl-(pentapeptide) pyrophosphoryl-undecaprenol N-acetylglucosamine transferase